MKRICLFAAYNYGDKVEDYVYDYLTELAKYTDIYYLADNTIKKDDPHVGRLLSICKNIYFVKHGMYDFGSWSLMAKEFVGWDIIKQYDELIFANDSCFCVQGFEKVFDKMDTIECDTWTLMATDENNKGYYETLEDYLKKPIDQVPMFTMGSYFMAFRKKVIEDLDFQHFINSVEKESNRLDVCMKYEMGLTKFLQIKNFKIDAFINTVYRGATIYNTHGIKFLANGFPLVKVKTFRDNPLSIKSLSSMKNLIKMYTGNDKIDEYLKQIGFVEHYGKPLRLNPLKLENWRPFFFKQKFKDIIIPLSPPIYIDIYKVMKHNLVNRKKSIHNRPSGKYIVYFNVSKDMIGGGMLSINRFVDKTLKHFADRFDDVIVSGVPLKNKPVKYSMFEQALPMRSFNKIVKKTYPKHLTLNIPEVFLPGFLNDLTNYQKVWLESIPHLHINILNQNHELFPDRLYIEMCKEYTNKVTVTMAHEEYCTKKVSESIDCPVKLLTPFLPEFYKRDFKDKEKIIAISPDQFIFDGIPKKDEALVYLKSELPDYKIVIIENLKLEEYKQLISKALFTISFGEGYDGYYIEPLMSDSLSFAVYNETFFPPQFKDAPTVYTSYEKFMENIVSDIRKLEKDAKTYKKYSNISEKMTKEVTNDEISLKNLKDFYNGDFDFVPRTYKNLIKGE